MRTTGLARFGLLVALSLSAGCADAPWPPLAEFPHAFATTACAPWGPGATVVFASREAASPPQLPRGPQLNVFLYQPWAELATGRYRLGPASQTSVLLCPYGNTPCQPATAGTLDYRRPSPQQLELDLDATFDHGARLRGRLRVVWAAEARRCT